MASRPAGFPFFLFGGACGSVACRSSNVLRTASSCCFVTPNQGCIDVLRRGRSSYGPAHTFQLCVVGLVWSGPGGGDDTAIAAGLPHWHIRASGTCTVSMPHARNSVWSCLGSKGGSAYAADILAINLRPASGASAGILIISVAHLCGMAVAIIHQMPCMHV